MVVKVPGAPVVKPGDSGTRPGWLRTGRRSGRPNQYKLLCWFYLSFYFVAQFTPPLVHPLPSGCRNPKFAKLIFWLQSGAQMAPRCRPRACLGRRLPDMAPKWRPGGAKLIISPFFALFCFPCFHILVLCFHDLFECFLSLTYKRLILEVASQSSWKHVKHYSMLKSLNCPWSEQIPITSAIVRIYAN